MTPTAVPPAVAQVAQRFAASTRGIVSFRLHRVLDVGAGFSHRHEDLTLLAVAVNGTVMRVRIESYTIDGNPASASDTANMVQAYQAPKPGQVFALPFDARHVSEYRYAASAPQTVTFTSTIHNGAHGNGTFAYDGDYHVAWYTYRPNVLPPHATWGSILDRCAQVLPDYWGVTRETQDYKGRFGPFSGQALETVDFSGYRRFPDLQSALDALPP
jgi:hypothetical protein